jgi:lipopolysaccharide transport system permease protein
LIPQFLRAGWQYRYFIFNSVVSEFKNRYARSSVGLLWAMLHPLATAAIFAFVLAEIIGSKLPGSNDRASYAVYLIAGMLAWNLFADLLGRSALVFLEYGSALKKSAIPRICLPVIVVLTALLNNLLLWIASALVLAMLGHTPAGQWLAVLPALVVAVLLGLGIGFGLGVLNVFSRDVWQVTSVVLQLWFWVTPVIYSLAMVPVAERALLEQNPMTPVVVAYQSAILRHEAVSYDGLWMPLMIGLCACLLSVLLYVRAANDISDAI